MDLIDREELLKTLCNFDYVKWYYSDLVDAIINMPTVDAVEVVRCKDCQYSHEPSVLVKGLVECEKSCSGECLKREDWYCPLGERRGD